jgi:hypothetical protein
MFARHPTLAGCTSNIIEMSNSERKSERAEATPVALFLIARRACRNRRGAEAFASFYCLSIICIHLLLNTLTALLLPHFVCVTNHISNFVVCAALANAIYSPCWRCPLFVFSTPAFVCRKTLYRECQNTDSFLLHTILICWCAINNYDYWIMSW